MKVLETEALVVGAGPGGTTVANLLAKSNIDVLLVDRTEFPRNKVCGGVLTPQSLNVLRRLDILHLVETQFNPFSHIQIYSDTPQGSSLISTRPCFGYTAPRLLLDQLLLNHAIQNGARFLPNVTIIRPQMINRQVVGAFGKQGDTDIAIEAKVTVSADGSAGCLAAKLGLYKQSAPEALAIRGYFYGVKYRVDTLELYYLKNYLPFFGWIIPINAQIANIGIGMITKRHKQINIKKQFLDFLDYLSRISDRLSSAIQINAPEAFPLRMNFDPFHTYMSGALLVGDAAGLVNPLTGLGIGAALESAELAAAQVVRSVQQKDASRRVLRGYGFALIRKYWFPCAYARLFRYGLNIPRFSARMLKLLQYS